MHPAATLYVRIAEFLFLELQQTTAALCLIRPVHLPPFLSLGGYLRRCLLTALAYNHNRIKLICLLTAVQADQMEHS